MKEKEGKHEERDREEKREGEKTKYKEVVKLKQKKVIIERRRKKSNGIGEFRGRLTKGKTCDGQGREGSLRDK